MARAVARYRIEADDSQSRRALRRVQRGFADTQKSALGLGKRLLAVAGIGGFGAIIKSTITTAAEIGKMSRQLGVSTELLSEMRGVVAATGGEYDNFIEGTKTLAERIREMSDGSKTVIGDFKAMGLSLEDFSGLDQERSILRFVEALSKMEAGSNRTAIAQALLSDDAQTFLRLADAGVGKIDRLRAAQVELGNSLSREMTDSAEKATAALGRLNGILQGLTQSAVLRWIENVADALDGIVASVQFLSGKEVTIPGARDGFALDPRFAGGAAQFVRTPQLVEQLGGSPGSIESRPTGLSREDLAKQLLASSRKQEESLSLIAQQGSFRNVSRFE